MSKLTLGNKRNIEFVEQHKEVVEAGQRLMQQRREEYIENIKLCHYHILTK